MEIVTSFKNLNWSDWPLMKTNNKINFIKIKMEKVYTKRTIKLFILKIKYEKILKLWQIILF